MGWDPLITDDSSLVASLFRIPIIFLARSCIPYSIERLRLRQNFFETLLTDKTTSSGWDGLLGIGFIGGGDSYIEIGELFHWGCGWMGEWLLEIGFIG